MADRKKNTKPEAKNIPVNTGSSTQKKSMVVRVIILVVAAAMFLGAIIIPFMASGSI